MSEGNTPPSLFDNLDLFADEQRDYRKLSIGIKTVKFQRGYGHPGKSPKRMRYEMKSGIAD